MPAQARGVAETNPKPNPKPNPNPNLTQARGVAENLPGNASTYVFTEEASYLAHYRRALVAVPRRADRTLAPTPTLALTRA